MLNGYQGKILHVNLSEMTWSVETPPEDFYRTYMGGSAMGTYYLLKNTPPHADPLGPENTLVFALSALTGAPFSGQSRMTAVAKSPLTGAVGDSQCGGFFPAEMKFAGFDAIVLHGKAPSPVYLWIHDGQVEIRPAGYLWGKVTGECEQAIKAELGDPKVEVLQCGPAGEKGVRFAALINMCSRVNGRTGMGAVMGSKNLKAVAVRGTSKKMELADRPALIELARWGAEHLKESQIYGLAVYGTASAVNWQNMGGGLPTRNYSSGVCEGAETLDGTAMTDSILVKRDTCYACTMRCKRVVEVKEGPYRVDPLYGGPEYETVAAFGSYCGVTDLKAVSYANQLCNMYGLDTITCGATIAWAMDCFERGLLTTADTGGIQLHFGDADAVIRLVKSIARREGIGDLLAEGSVRAAERLGRGSQDLLVAVKGQELPAHMPQIKRSLGLIYAVNPYGADHESSEHDPSYEYPSERLAALGLSNPQPADSLNDEKVRFALLTQYFYSCMDTLNVCHFTFGPSWQLYGPDQLVQAVHFVTGWEVAIEDLMQWGARRVNLMRIFNAREGIGRQQDVLPGKISRPLVGGKSNGMRVPPEEIETAKDTYYALAGWDIATGFPTRKRLEELGLFLAAEGVESIL